MRKGCLGVLLAAMAVPLPSAARAQQVPDAPVPASEPAVTDALSISADLASTWADGGRNVVLLDGSVRIEANDARLSADRAVLWITQVNGRTTAQIALLGNAAVVNATSARTGAELFVTTEVAGPVRLNADRREVVDRSNSDVYKRADALRPSEAAKVATRPATAPSTNPTSGPSTAPVTLLPPANPVRFQADSISTRPGSDGKVTVLLSGGVKLLNRRPDGTLVELTGARAVLFTTLDRLSDLAQTGSAANDSGLQSSITSAYLEGDVRVVVTPGDRGNPEKRLEADRAYYEFAPDRAILTDAVLRTAEPTLKLPITLRAEVLRQVSAGEYKAVSANLSTSNFATPDYALKADRVYVRQAPPNDLGVRSTAFQADAVTLNGFGVPFFYLPRVAGNFSEGAIPLRNIGVEQSRNFGFGFTTEWGLFESLGLTRPAGLDATYQLDYLQERGLAGGLDFNYGGGQVTDAGPAGYDGRFTSFFVNDHGTDRLGRRRGRINRDGLRGRADYEHTQYFAGDVELQLRAGYVTDPTFLEEFFQRDYNEGLPTEFSAYLKRARETEAVTLLVSYQPYNFVTTADQLQELAAVQRLPELQYLRLGDSLDQDRLTLFSENSLAALKFRANGLSLRDEYGFVDRRGAEIDESFRGIPSYGYTSPIGPDGLTRAYDETTTLRADFRQELDAPFTLADGRIKVVPYLVGRYTGYDESAAGGGQNRFLLGGGVRASTAFYSIDNSARSALFDINRIRHVIEPEVDLFSSWSSVPRDDLYIYEPGVDGVAGITGGRIALNQRWQTKRGGPGRERSVDFFTFNVGANLFTNEPREPFAPRNAPEGIRNENAQAFRGLYFSTEPEASQARNSVDAEATWRVSDTTAIISDASYNLQEGTLATAAVGVAAQRGDRISYYVGGRYIGEINTSLARLALTYKLSDKYSVILNQSFDLDQGNSRSTSLTVIRRFDRFLVNVSLYFDRIDQEGGLRVGIIPYGLSAGFNSGSLDNFLNK